MGLCDRFHRATSPSLQSSSICSWPNSAARMPPVSPWYQEACGRSPADDDHDPSDSVGAQTSTNEGTCQVGRDRTLVEVAHPVFGVRPTCDRFRLAHCADFSDRRLLRPIGCARINHVGHQPHLPWHHQLTRSGWFLKYSIVAAKPVSRSVLGSHPRISRALVMSGQRRVGHRTEVVRK